MDDTYRGNRFYMENGRAQHAPLARSQSSNICNQSNSTKTSLHKSNTINQKEADSKQKAKKTSPPRGGSHQQHSRD